MSKIRPSRIIALLPFLWGVAQGQDQSAPGTETGLLEQTVPVADEPPPIADEGPRASDDAPSAEDVAFEHQRFIQLLEDRNYDEADIAAKRIIEMAIKVYGPVSHETAKALNNLGFVQNNNEQYDAAVQNFTSAIEILETLEDRLNSSLINPLRGLGAAQLGAGRPDQAAQTFDRATHITHVNEGPHNLEQVEILEAMAEANVRLGDLDTARDVLDRIHILNVRHFSNDALGLLPSLMRRATWQHRAGYHNDERATYRRAIRIVEESAGRDDPRLIEPLLRLGRSFYTYQPEPDALGRPISVTGGGEIYLKRANKIAERAKDMQGLDKAKTRLALADYYIATDSFTRARRIYEEVWSDLSADESLLEFRGDLLDNPRPIWTEPLPPYTSGAVGATDRRDGEIRTGTVTVDFIVDRRGRARLLETRTNPDEFSDMERMVERSVERRRYRPTISDGHIVDSTTQTFTHEFRYKKAELDEIRAEEASNEQTTARSQ